MAYVALSHVRTLCGVYLTKFEPDSIIVDPKIVKEINPLRASFQSDLPSHTVLSYRKKRKSMGVCDLADALKKRNNDPSILKHKSWKRELDDDQHKVVPQSKKTNTDTSGSGVLAFTKFIPKEDNVQIVEKSTGAGPSGQHSVRSNFHFYPFNSQWL